MNQEVYQQHQRYYLQFEYYNKCKQIYKLEEQNQKLLSTINDKINAFECQLLKQHFDRLKQKEETKIRTIHKDKIQHLSKGNIKLDQVDVKKVMHNISSREVFAEEESIVL
ncbi:unnamed protein product [Rotaria sordida]|uniref:Uncharacterized protein n=1 Tax=Rotaria sordida TaxID=392033 RepID=A0A814NFX4_9BILA|nr:unnamed protein product [Rotaria sordida]CAF1288300.1 unnamed protein product [Rotaria sordida]